jgi:hypothetical protein
MTCLQCHRLLKGRQKRSCSTRCRCLWWRREQVREVDALRARDRQVRELLQAALRKLEDAP